MAARVDLRTQTCIGTGNPTVVIEYGWGDSSTSWSKAVQPEVARTTRVCTYGRASTGPSEAGPMPRTAARFAQELHTLLRRASIPGPYVLVGHSLGGTTVRLFAHEYASDVAGVVLVDSMSRPALIVLSRGVDQDPDWQSMQAELLLLSSKRGKDHHRAARRYHHSS